MLAGLVPRRALTPAMLANGVASILEFFDDILVDYPRAVGEPASEGSPPHAPRLLARWRALCRWLAGVG